MTNIGKIVKELRDSKGISRFELSNHVFCSESTIKRIENNETKISLAAMVALNNYFKIELYDYYSIINRFGDYDKYLFCMDLYKSIENRNMDEIKAAIEKSSMLNINIDTELYSLVSYAEALSMYLGSKLNYNQIIDFILYKLDIDDIEEISSLIKNNRESFSLYSLLNLLSILYDESGNFEICYFISKELYHHFDSVIFTEKYFLEKHRDKFQKQYVCIINNYADALYNNGEYDEALKICLLGIERAIKYQTLQSLDFLYALLAEIHYKFGNLDECKKAFDYFLVLCDLKGNEELKIRKKKEFSRLGII